MEVKNRDGCTLSRISEWKLFYVYTYRGLGMLQWLLLSACAMLLLHAAFA
jgi:hypothetical protein